MKKINGAILLFAVAWSATAAFAGTVSYTGTLTSPETPVDFVINVPVAGTVTLQTFGFGGGVNAAGTTILPGGTDPFLAIFSGTGDSATIVTDSFGNPYGTSADVTNYSSFVGCGPANTEDVNGNAICGDITMSIPSLASGTYTVVLGDGEYIANAIFDDGTLGEGFADFTGDDPTTLPPTPGIFCNIVVDNAGDSCPNNSGAYALDITLPDAVSSAPEPTTSVLLGFSITALAFRRRRRGKE